MSDRRILVRALTAAVASSALAAALHGQGTGQHLNLETPVHRPLKVVTVGSLKVLLVCNSPDNAVEVWNTANNGFIARVPVGQEPITVQARPQPEATGGLRCYTANWLGDSITAFELTHNTSGTGPLVNWKVLRTIPVGDEPTDIEIVPTLANVPGTEPGGAAWQSLLVTFSAQQAWGWFHPDTLVPLASFPPPGGHTGFRELGDPTGTLALKDPRALAFAPAGASGGNVPNRLWILNRRGGNDASSTFGDGHDHDLWATDDLGASTVSQMSTLPAVGGLGSTNFNMDFAPNGDLWVSGQFARNKDALLTQGFVMSVGEPVMQGLAIGQTGFVTSEIYRVRGNGAVERRDLNLSGGGPTPSLPITLPRDVLVYGTGAAGATRVFVTGMGSDTIGCIVPGGGGPSTWSLFRINVAHRTNAFSAGNTNGVWRGPAAFALKASGTPNDPTDRLYVLNRGTHSFMVCNPNYNTGNPNTFVLANVPLSRNPELPHVKDGRKFLYSTALSDAPGFVSCASCHDDGRSDFLAWNLSNNHAIAPEFSPAALVWAIGPNAANKGPMQTQSLLGLVNFEVPANDVAQDIYFTNKPYHWRGDKGLFEHFNAAFVNLLGLPDISGNTSGNGDLNKGIPDAAMTSFRRFVFSMHYPPNPRQNAWRRYGGTMFSTSEPPDDPAVVAAEVNDPTLGSGAEKGLKLFHILPSDLPIDTDFDTIPDAAASCVHCHMLPDGSNNRLTEAFFYRDSALEAQSLETTQLKGLASKEKLRIRFDPLTQQFISWPNATSPAQTGEFGLLHTGQTTLTGAMNLSVPAAFGSLTVLDFTKGFLGGAPFLVTQQDVDDMTRFVQEFDTGTAPLVGYSNTGDLPLYGADPAGVSYVLTLIEDQARMANIGVAVHGRLQGIMRGFWFDVRDGATPYHELAQPGLATLPNMNQGQLLSYIDPANGANFPDNILALHCTPLGAERRVAYLPGGNPPANPPTMPAAIQLLGARPMVANRHIPQMTANWADLAAKLYPFFFIGAQGFVDGLRNDATALMYQTSLIAWAQGATPPAFGANALRHEPPRRFHLQGSGIEPGARLRLWAPTPADIATATATTPPTTLPNFNPATNPWFIEVPMFPTIDGNGAVRWESAAEMESILLYSMMNGGPWNAWSATAYLTPTLLDALTLLSIDLMQPQLWNWWYVQVVNDPASPAGTTANAGWQRITME